MTRRRSRKPKKTVSQPQKVKPIITRKDKKKYIYIFSLIAIFCLVLFFNSYFNYTSGIAHNPSGETLGTRFFLSGPDPYYNMRLCEVTMETGSYPFIEPHGGDFDPLLNYPVGERGARPPLFNLITVGVANMFGGTIDALGWTMLFLPAIYGALLVFPIYGIGKELFNRKVGLFASFFLAILPIHFGSSHGSSWSLFDHDSFLLLLFAITFYFLIKALKERENNRAILYGALAGFPLASVYLTWVASQFLFILILLFLIVQLFMDLFLNRTKRGIKIPMTIITTFLVAFLITIPYALIREDLFGFPLIVLLASFGIFSIYYVVNRFRIPWIISIPGIVGLAGAGLSVLYLIYIDVIAITGALRTLAITIFGAGIYGSKISLTIGEAHTSSMSMTAMSFGPALYWFGLAGFVLYLVVAWRNKLKPEAIFFITIMFVEMWLSTNAGRFLNDLVPLITVFAGFATLTFIDKLEISEMIKQIKYKRFKKLLSIKYISVILIMFLLIIPNVFISLDSAVPANMKEDVFGEEHSPAFGLSLNIQYYWADACYWLSQQDTEYSTDAERPGVISWWDYGFYLSSMSKHPTVADNYQDGIAPAGNFLTSQSEKDAIVCLIIRLLEGDMARNEIISDEANAVLSKYDLSNFTYYVENPTECESYNKLVSPEYGNNVLRVTEQNAPYHDAVAYAEDSSEEQIVLCYKELREATGYSIEYVAMEQRDLHIFAVFPFLSDKATHGYVTSEDDFFVTKYRDTKTGNVYTDEMLDNMTPSQIDELSLSRLTEYKEAFYNSIYYRLYYGLPVTSGVTDNRQPGYGMKHFKLAYATPYVTIFKYYEGISTSGTIILDNETMEMDNLSVYTFDDNGIFKYGSHVINPGYFSTYLTEGNNTLVINYNDTKVGEKVITVTEEQAIRNADFNESIEIRIE